MKLKDIAAEINGELIGDGSIEISGMGKIEHASKGEITFIANPLYEKHFADTNAAAVIVSNEFDPEKIKRKNPVPIIRVEDPYTAFLTMLQKFSPVIELQPKGIHKSAVISQTAAVSDKEISIGANVFIGEGCKIGSAANILPNTVILTGAEVGDGVLIYPNVTIYPGCKIGNRVIIHSGTVIGSDGFGMAKNPDGTYKKIPQTGIVIIEDDVEIGSNCSIDRATMGATIIRKGAKLDNQIQIAHNVEIGENTVIAAHTGIAGSTKIGRRCMIGGGVEITGHIEICDDAILGGSTNVSKSITEPGIYSGYRTKPLAQDLKEQAILRNLAKRKK